VVAVHNYKPTTTTSTLRTTTNITIDILPKAYGENMVFLGDISSNNESLKVRDQIYKMFGNDAYVFALGDLTYSSNFTFFNEKYRYVFSFLKCTVGNHDLRFENKSLGNLIFDMCGENWLAKVKNTIIIGYNSEGNFSRQAIWAYRNINNSIFSGIDQAYLVGHRPCSLVVNETNSNYKFCQYMKSKIPISVNFGYISAHIHILSHTIDDKLNPVWIVGGGGAKHQSCDKPIWIYCNDIDFGFLSISIDDNNKSKINFINSDGKTIFHKKK
jgi:hypothetical protein